MSDELFALLVVVIIQLLHTVYLSSIWNMLMDLHREMGLRK